MAGSDPILGVCITPKSLRASEVAPVHEGNADFIVGSFFAPFSRINFCPCVLADPARKRWPFLPDPETERIPMPLLKSPDRPVAKRKYYIRIAEPLAQTMERYAEFISASSVEHVISQALELVFRKDTEFRAWLEKNPSGKKAQSTMKETL